MEILIIPRGKSHFHILHFKITFSHSFHTMNSKVYQGKQYQMSCCISSVVRDFLYLDYLCNLKLWYMHMRFSVWKARTNFVDRLKKHSAVLWWMAAYYLGFLTQDVLYRLRNKSKAVQGHGSLPHVVCRCAFVLKMQFTSDHYKNLARLNEWGKSMKWRSQMHNTPVIYCTMLGKLLAESDIRITLLSVIACLPVSQLHSVVI